MGTLACNVGDGPGLIIWSSRPPRLRLFGTGHSTGTIAKLGADIGDLQVARWGGHPGPCSLAGSYGGVTASAAIGPGVGAYALGSFMLQPVSVEGQTGFDVSGGLTTVNLQYAPWPSRGLCSVPGRAWRGRGALTNLSAPRAPEGANAMYRIWCVVSGGFTGHQEAWLLRDGAPVEYRERAAAHAEAARLNESHNGPYATTYFNGSVVEGLTMSSPLSWSKGTRGGGIDEQQCF